MRPRGVRHIIEQLQHDPDPSQRAAAARELSEFKDRASYNALLFVVQGNKEREFAVLSAVLDSLERRPDRTIRENINRKKTETAKRLIEQLREHHDPLKRAEAAEKLQGHKDDSSYKALVAALDDEHLAVSEAAAKALAGRRQPRAMKPLVNALSSALSQEKWFEAREFARALGQLADPRALVPLIESLAQAVEWIQSDISNALAAFGIIAVTPLIRSLNHVNAQVRAGAASALTTLAPHVIESLVETLRTGSPTARQGAATALSGAPSPKSVDALVAATLDTEAAVGEAAVRSLGKLRDPRALDALAVVLSNSEPSIRRAAVAALGKIEQPGAVDALIVVLGDAEVRAEAERSLAALGSMAIDPLARLLSGARSDIAESAAAVLGRIGRTALGPLLENLRGPLWHQRKAAAVGLGRTCNRDDSWNTPLYPQDLRKAVGALQDSLQDENAEVRTAAAQALAVLAGVARDGVEDGRGWNLMSGLPDSQTEMHVIQQAAESSIRCLVKLLDDRAFRVRVAAARALGIIGDPTAKEPLLDMLRRPSETARMAAAEAFVQVHDAKDATGIVAALADPDAAVRHAVAVAITKGAAETGGYFRKQPITVSPRSADRGHRPVSSAPQVRSLQEEYPPTSRHISPDPWSPHAWFRLAKDYVQVFIAKAVSDVVSALARLAQEEENLQVRLAVLQALETIRETIRLKREHGDPNILYAPHEIVESHLGIETEQETVARDAAAREGTRGESDRFTDVTLYRGKLFPGDSPAYSSRLSDQEALQARHEYTLEVAIRRRRTGIAATAPAPRPVLNPRQTTETLRIFVVARALSAVEIDEPVAAVDWPYNADSSPAFFRISVPDTLLDPEEGSVEVRLYHENLDLLDVVNVKFFVTAEGEEENLVPTRIDWPRSSRAERRLDPDKATRSLTIRVGPAIEGYKLDFVFLREDRTISFPLERHITPGDLEALLVKVRDFWSELVITNYENQLSVTLPTWDRYLKRLNELGAEAWELLFGSRVGTQKGASETVSDLLARMDFAGGTHVQVTYDRRVTDFVFPWSILYPPAVPGAAIDPRLFWGARYQIEQVWEGGSNDGLETEPVGVTIVVDRGFGEVKPEIDMFEGFKASAAGRLDVGLPISNRQDLLSALTDSPSHHLYYFFCHGYTPAGPPILRRDSLKLLRESIEALPPSEGKPWGTLLALTAKMADEAWIFIGDAQITESELRRARDFFKQRRPILFLNMCHSAALAPSVTRGLLRLFLDRDAAALIGTESPMTSVFAHAFARELLKNLFGGSDLGTALWRARRHFLGDEFRNPLGFAYTLYGRATSKLGAYPLVAAELT